MPRLSGRDVRRFARSERGGASAQERSPQALPQAAGYRRRFREPSRATNSKGFVDFELVLSQVNLSSSASFEFRLERSPVSRVARAALVCRDRRGASFPLRAIVCHRCRQNRLSPSPSLVLRFGTPCPEPHGLSRMGAGGSL